MLIEQTALYVRTRVEVALPILIAADAEYAVEWRAQRELAKKAHELRAKEGRQDKDAAINKHAEALIRENVAKRAKPFGRTMTAELSMEDAISQVKSTVIFMGYGNSWDFPSYLYRSLDYPNTQGISTLNALLSAVEPLHDEQKVMINDRELGLLRIGDSDG